MHTDSPNPTYNYMNRIVLIGNGFDLAHRLPTRYIDFIDGYFSDICKTITEENYGYADEDIVIHLGYGTPDLTHDSEIFRFRDIKSYKELCAYIAIYSKKYQPAVELSIKNSFLKIICDNFQYNDYQWVDIENDYFDELIKYIQKGRTKENIEAVRKFNDDVRKVEKRLGEYLSGVEEENSELKAIIELRNNIYSIIETEDIAVSSKRNYYNDLEQVINKYINDEEHVRNRELSFLSNAFKQLDFYRDYNDQFISEYLDNVINQIKVDDSNIKKVPKYFLAPRQILFLNFNYTATDQLYNSSISTHIHIHGELNESKNNPVILGFGDEYCEEFAQLESLRDNAFVGQIKSSRYSHTNNYRDFLKFMETEPYQVVILGHSCGNTDRTLLRSLFEHPNCYSIKPYYHQWKDGDNYNDLAMSISRIFSDKAKMRDRLVNKSKCKSILGK